MGRENKSKKSKGQQSSSNNSICTRLSQFSLVATYIFMNALASYVLYSPELTEMVYLFTVGVVVLLVRFVFMFLFLADFRLPFSGYFGAGYERVSLDAEVDEEEAFVV